VEIVLFTVVGIALYLLCDRLLVLFETMHGERLPYRNVIFFVMILMLSLSGFSLMRTLMHPGEGAQDNNQEQQATDGRDQATQAH
jgi:hypothetical protein